MIPQISKLGSKYYEWVNLPVDRPLRLFKSNVLEKLSKVSFSVVASNKLSNSPRHAFGIPMHWFCVPFTFRWLLGRVAVVHLYNPYKT